MLGHGDWELGGKCMSRVVIYIEFDIVIKLNTVEYYKLNIYSERDKQHSVRSVNEATSQKA